VLLRRHETAATHGGDRTLDEAAMRAGQGKVKGNEDSMEAKMAKSMNVIKEWMEASITSTRSDFEENIDNRLEGVLASVDQRTHGLCEESSAETKDFRIEFGTASVV
jgi:hypothetical protein